MTVTIREPRTKDSPKQQTLSSLKPKALDPKTLRPKTLNPIALQTAFPKNPNNRYSQSGSLSASQRSERSQASMDRSKRRALHILLVGAVSGCSQECIRSTYSLHVVGPNYKIG